MHVHTLSGQPIKERCVPLQGVSPLLLPGPRNVHIKAVRHIPVIRSQPSQGANDGHIQACGMSVCPCKESGAISG